MKIKSIYISQGIFWTERFFESGFNLIFSEKNSTGKTTLMRCLLFRGPRSLKLNRAV